MIGRALERTARLWPSVERAFAPPASADAGPCGIGSAACCGRWVHAAARLLGNPENESAGRVRRRFDGLLAAMQRHRDRVGELGTAVAHFRKVARSYRPGLFQAEGVPDLPRTNNALEQLFGSQRSHERRATGRKTASPGAVLRGPVRLVAATATRLRAPSGQELGRVDREKWSTLRRHLEQARRARTLRTRFRRDPDTYLVALEQQLRQPTLPS
jgi:hypothetical protein